MMKKTRRILLHILFWILSGLFLGAIIGIKNENALFTWLFVALLLPVAALTSYAINYYLFPRFLFRKAYFKFFLYGSFLFTLSIYLEAIISLVAFVFIADYDVESMPEIAGNLPLMGVSLYFIVFLSALIYLIKRGMVKTESEEELNKPDNPQTNLLVRSNREMIQLAFTDIDYIESLSDYVKIHLSDKTVITKERISKIQDKLPDHFIRIHRSYIVNTKKIESFTKEKVKVKSEKLPISRTYKKDVLTRLDMMPTTAL